MLIVNLIGGLGNQMFQYAFGRAISLKRNSVVKYNAIELLDRTPRANFTFRDYELDIFNTHVTVSSQEEINLYKYHAKGVLERGYYKAVRLLKSPDVFNEKAPYIYDLGIYNTSDYTYFDGYWQNEQYFREYEDVIRADFTFRTLPKGKNLELSQQIKEHNTIAIHVRRGDYVSNTVSSQVHGICTPDYYREAVELVHKQVENPLLVIFSDEPQWVRENLDFELPTIYVSHNHGKDSFEDMRLMSLCQHNIIANSSFSWWGAWLNNNPKKIVVAPRQWVQDESIDSSSLTPSTWIRL